MLAGRLDFWLHRGYDLLFRAAAETLLTIAADPQHPRARIGFTAVLHSWGSALIDHPHLHMVVPGGGISLDGARWVSCRSGFLVAVRVLSRLFRRLFLEGLADAHPAGRLVCFGELDSLGNPAAFAVHLAPLRKTNWFVYAKPPFAGPEAVLAYLARYTHRVAISKAASSHSTSAASPSATRTTAATAGPGSAP